MIDKKKQGKRNRAAGGRFESKVRKDLEDMGWIVAKWTNNVEFRDVKDVVADSVIIGNKLIMKWGQLIPAKRKFNPFNKALTLGTGFPDFIAYKHIDVKGYEEWTIMGVEAKSNGYLDKEEREKCKWLIDNKIFSKIIIAKKGKKRGEIEYVEFEEKMSGM